jgi:hypothetical protein
MVTRYYSYSCFVLLKMGDSETRNMYSSSQTKINSVTCASCWDLYTRISIYVYHHLVSKHEGQFPLSHPALMHLSFQILAFSYVVQLSSSISITILHATNISLLSTIPNKTPQVNIKCLLTAKPSVTNTVTVELIQGTLRGFPSKTSNNFADSLHILSATWFCTGHFTTFI